MDHFRHSLIKRDSDDVFQCWHVQGERNAYHGDQDGHDLRLCFKDGNYDANGDTCDDNEDDSCKDNDDDSGDVFNVGACNQRDMKEGDHVTEAFHL